MVFQQGAANKGMRFMLKKESNDKRLTKEIELHKNLSKSYNLRHELGYAKIHQVYWNEEILKRIPQAKNVKILDLGCGTGAFLPDLANNYDFVVGMDLSLDMLKKIETKNQSLKGLVSADGSRLPFSSGAFDIIVCRSSLHHVRKLGQALEEISRILKKDGILVFSEPSNDSLPIRLARKIMYKASSRFDEGDEAFLTEDLLKSLSRQGFTAEESSRFGFLSYLFTGYPDHFPVLKFIPFNEALSRLFVQIDKVLSKLPVIKNQSFHLIVRARKKGA